MTPPLSWWETLLWCFLGISRRIEGECFSCGYRGQIIDLGDDDFVCDRCYSDNCQR
jgi:hypothetical protein